MPMLRVISGLAANATLTAGGLGSVVYSVFALTQASLGAAQLLQQHRPPPLFYWVEHFALNLCMCALGLWLLGFVARRVVAELRDRASAPPADDRPPIAHAAPELRTRIADAKPQFGRRAG